MVKKFAVFEKKILKLFDDIDAEDNVYDAYELSRPIQLINGLRKRQETTAIQMQKLHAGLFMRKVEFKECVFPPPFIPLKIVKN